MTRAPRNLLLFALIAIPACAATEGSSGTPAGKSQTRPAADFDLPALGGKGTEGDRVRLASTKGHVTLLDFWASWCGPCREELPALEKLKQEYAPRGVAFIAINIDAEAEAAASMAKQLGITFPVGLDPEKKVASAYDLPTMPTSYVIDANGQIRYAHQGFFGDKDIAHFHAELDELLK